MTNTENAAAAQFCRTHSATTRHIVKPEDTRKTLCGGRVSLREHFTGDDGQPMTCEGWMVRDLPQCERCERSAAKRGIEIAG
jgi:hypothetical protein